jgi:uncharacterized protein YndB with AHSA1/START domain
MQGSYATIDGRPALRFERRLGHPVEKVWRAVTDPAELGHWFPAEVEVDLRVGGTIAFVFPGGEGPPGSGEVTELDPPRLFAFTWDGDALRFELSPDGAGCRLRFTHVFEQADTAARDAAGWHVCLDVLERRLAGEDTASPSGDPTEPWRALYEQYVADGMPHGAPVPS